jgi:CheY-like chemotaxis protein
MKPKVLIVDDDTVMHLLYKRPLASAGYELLTAKDGEEARKIISEQAPQIIVMDIMMPGVDGLSVVRELKHSEVSRDIPVIVATANLERYTTAKQESKDSGAVAFLSKPLSPGRLVAEIQRFVPAPVNES